MCFKREGKRGTTPPSVSSQYQTPAPSHIPTTTNTTNKLIQNGQDTVQAIRQEGSPGKEGTLELVCREVFANGHNAVDRDRS